MTKSMALHRTFGANVESVWSVLSNIGRTADYNPAVYQSQGEDETEVTMVANLHPDTVLQNLMTIPAKGMMIKVLGRVLDGLDHHVVTGESITADFKTA